MPHRHVAAQGLYFASWLIIINFVADVLAGAFNDSVAARGVKQSITGA